MRIPKLRSLAYLYNVMKHRYFLSDSQQKYHDYFSGLNNGKREVPNLSHVVTVQCVEDVAYFGIFGSIITELRKTNSLRADLYILRSLRVGSSISLKQYFWSMASFNIFSDNVWRQLYLSFCDRVAYRSASWMAPWTELRILWKTICLWRGLRSADDLASLNVRGIPIGDLIIDSYIRFKPSPMIRLDDPYLAVVMRQALRDVEKAFHYFGTVKPDLYLTSYTTYVQHGVASRVAAACGTRVYAFGNFQEFSKRITVEDAYHTKRVTDYARDFSNLPDRPDKIAEANRQLSARLAGKIDTATAYMKTSAYQGKKENLPELRGSVIVFLHDFYDSIHIYPWILFHDFWAWICFTIETLRRHDIPFLVKPHPNQTASSDQTFLELCRKYPDLKILPSAINNKTLIEAGIVGAVTVYGTVTCEMAYLGVPTISCGDNPHSSFSFGRVARSHAEYEAMLRDFRSLRIDRVEMREQACVFFYMHNMNLGKEAAELHDKSIKLRTTIWANPTRSAEDVIADFQEFQAGDGLNVFCKRLRHIG